MEIISRLLANVNKLAVMYVVFEYLNFFMRNNIIKVFIYCLCVIKVIANPNSIEVQTRWKRSFAAAGKGKFLSIYMCEANLINFE